MPRYRSRLPERWLRDSTLDLKSRPKRVQISVPGLTKLFAQMDKSRRNLRRTCDAR